MGKICFLPLLLKKLMIVFIIIFPFLYKNLKNDSSRRVPVPFSSGQRAVFNFDFNFESLSLKPGDKIEYYFTVGDNDQIHGSKETSSNAKYIHIPDKKEFKEKRDERRNHQNKV